MSPIKQVTITITKRNGIKIIQDIEHMNLSFLTFLWLKFNNKLTKTSNYRTSGSWIK